jgi:tRNA/rRNA methyltransferase
MRGDIIFILYKPAVPGNIGASARAMKTMGFDQLRLIDPADHMADESLMMAHGSKDILEKAQVFQSFEDAVKDIDFVIASTAKNRSAKEDYIDSRDLSEMLSQKKDILGKVGVLFGTEESGLPNQLILQSNIAVTIPMNEPYPSLNLSQAVMIMVYEMSRLSLPEAQKDKEEMSIEGWKQLDLRVKNILSTADIKPQNPLYNRILERVSFLNAGDAGLLHSVTSRLGKKFKS